MSSGKNDDNTDILYIVISTGAEPDSNGEDNKRRESGGFCGALTECKNGDC